MNSFHEFRKKLEMKYLGLLEAGTRIYALKTLLSQHMNHQHTQDVFIKVFY